VTSSSQTRSTIGFLVGAALLIGGVGSLWGWALPLVVLAILLMVMAHEFGHYIVAKRSGMLVTDFFVGFGPVLWATTRGETRYGIRALPLGGFVKVPGMTWIDEIDPALESRTYRSASYPRKVLFASAGSLVHLLLALVLAWASLVFFGTTQASSIGIAGFDTWAGHPTNAAQQAGLHPGDVFVSINGVSANAMSVVIDEVRAHANQSITIVVRRHGHDLTVHATPQDGRNLRVGGEPLATGKMPQGFLGIALTNEVVKSSPLAAVPSAASLVWSTAIDGVRSLAHVVSPGEVSSIVHQITSPHFANSPQTQLSRPVSIVGVVRIADQAAQSNRDALLLILMNLNVFVGILNMLPMLPLDGGYVAVATYERLRRRGGTIYRANLAKLTPFVYFFLLVLGLLFLATLYLDVVDPITNPFK